MKSKDNVKDIIESISENNEEMFRKIIQELEQTYLAKVVDETGGVAIEKIIHLYKK